MSDIDTAVVDSLKVLDPRRPIREADIGVCRCPLWRGIADMVGQAVMSPSAKADIGQHFMSRYAKLISARYQSSTFEAHDALLLSLGGQACGGGNF